MVVSADNQLYALDGQTGRPSWRHAGFFEGTGLLGGPSPAVADGVVVVPYSSAEVFGLRLDNGRPLWSDTVQRPRRTEALAQINDIDGYPVIDGRPASTSPATAGRWRRSSCAAACGSGTSTSAAPRRHGSPATSSTSLTTRGEVVCLLRENGRIRWVSPLPRLTDPDDPASTADHLDRAAPGRRPAADRRLATARR